VFGGRTGGSNASHHIDNITVLTDFTGDSVQGDFNFDSVVDMEDYMILLANMNTQGLFLDISNGDIDFNRRVNLADFIAFRRAFEEFQAGAGAAGVPEPHGCLLALSGLLGLCFRRRATGKR
jgi:hypothetical protein